eukprot:TRINITY_DN13119_c0_g1_i3.p4 TRINITY_DN13119_c0_g1~~TRINITY_DN13119_c0_g1_i3.p4  ORF type:complete len:103 (-),score=2.17 TRINITY_DN13119_c0_g1_i3:166-474(-)
MKSSGVDIPKVTSIKMFDTKIYFTYINNIEVNTLSKKKVLYRMRSAYEYPNYGRAFSDEKNAVKINDIDYITVSMYQDYLHSHNNRCTNHSHISKKLSLIHI